MTSTAERGRGFFRLGLALLLALAGGLVVDAGGFESLSDAGDAGTFEPAFDPAEERRRRAMLVALMQPYLMAGEREPRAEEEPPLLHLAAAEPMEPPPAPPAPPAGARAVGRDWPAPVPQVARRPFERLRAIEPAAGITFRSDPLDPPLLEAQRWNEWILAVTLNGSVVSDGVFVIEEPATGRLAIELATAEAWRLAIDRDRIMTFNGVPFLPLDALPGTAVVLDRAALALALDIPPEIFGLFRLGVEEAAAPSPTPGTGAFFDYDLLATGGGGVDGRLDGLLEAGLFAGGNVLLGNFRVEDLGGQTEAQRLETTFIRDFPDRRASLRLGDSLSNGGAFAQGVRFGGLQWATNFATDPAFVTFPLLTIGGLAQQDSVVDVLVDNLVRATERVPPGPFAIDNVPVVTGGGEVQLRVTDLLGRERLVTQPYYVSPRLLRPGLGDFSYEAGFKREAFGEASFDYGDLMASATHRHGFTERVTGEAHAELEAGRASLVAGGALLLGPYGLLTGGIGGSADDDAGEGVMGQLAYEYQGRRLSLGLRTRYTSDGFRQAAGDDGILKRVDQLDIGLDALRYGRLGLLLINQERHDGQDHSSAALSYSLPLGPGALVVNAARTLRPKADLALTAAYSIPLGPTTSLTASGRLGRGNDRGRLQYTRTRGASELGFDYRVAGEIGDDARPIDARLGYQAGSFAATAEIERFSGDDRFRFGLSGSAALVDGKFGLTRRIGRSFGLVDLPGFPNVRVYLDNRIAGTTDAEGRLLLPNLRPYEPNRIRLEVEDLPLSAELATGEVAAVPYDRSGMTIDLGIVATQRATAILRDGDEAPLPAGLVLASEEGDLEAMVGRDGFTQLSGRLDERRYLTGEADGRRFVCVIKAVPPDDPLPHLGELRCAD